MQDSVYLLIFNAGSSSLKFELFARRDGWRSHARGSVTSIGKPEAAFRGRVGEAAEPVEVGDHRDAAELVLDRLRGDGRLLAKPNVLAIGHRVVHGGEYFSHPVLVDSSVLKRLEALAELAPLHNPPALEVMHAARERFADVPMCAVFDTTFFRDLPEHVRAYAIPAAWRQRHRIRRYGFHGIAHEYLHGRYAESTPGSRRGERVISLHLGQGCSAAALRDGRPVETSMGFTPLEGLIMGTRSGDLDPGAIVHLARKGQSPDELDGALNRESGLLGLSGATDDVRELLELEAAGEPRARLALAAFCHRIHKYVGAYAAVLGGVDAVLFGGGIGENSPILRRRICEGLEWLGLELDEEANARPDPGARLVSAAPSPIEVHVIPVREEEAIARATLECLGRDDIFGAAGPESAG